MSNRHLLVYFEQLLIFLLQEGLHSENSLKTMLDHYLSQKEQKNMLTTAQIWKQEGRKEGRKGGISLGKTENARLTVLRGLFRKMHPAVLAELSDLPKETVEVLSRGFRSVKGAWKRRKVDIGALSQKTDLTESEILFVLKNLESQQ
jgi:hypothetical protein